MIDPDWIPEALLGLSDHLAAELEGKVLHLPEYTGAETLPVIVRGAMPPRPEQVVALRYYDTLQTEPFVDLFEVYLQVRSRTTARAEDGLRLHGAIHGALHEKSGLVLGRARASLILGGSLAYMGVDDNGRHEYAQNFRVRTSGRLAPV